MSSEDLHTWSDAIESHLTQHRIRFINRVMIVRETGSTQDVARQAAAGPGLLVLAGRQTGGRGRLGRSWADSSHMGVAATFAIDASDRTSAHLSTAAGLAMCMAVEDVLNCGSPSDAPVGLRWPNDVVERTPRGPGRKLAGVLVETSGSLALVGIGVNVLQNRRDWPTDLAQRASSLAQLGARVTRLQVALALITRLEQALRASESDIESWWTPRDVMIGSRQSFIHDNVAYTGVIEKVSPRDGVQLRTDDGVQHHLPPLTTSLAHDSAAKGLGR
ncbi:MAG TPA: biotin--[acetyl-CoA-carboxylase] ligase [Phycisphaerales bacterium]|nr:biotin--[acetyl-CoA-carboxylase] ligase [Phycisphaerales bacterium]